MSKPHPIELRERVVAFVDEGHGHRESARHFRVSPKFVNDMIKLLGLALNPSPKLFTVFVLFGFFIDKSI